MAAQTTYGPIATHLRFENEHVRVWEMDLARGQLCGLHRHTLDYVLYILEGGRIAVELHQHVAAAGVADEIARGFLNELLRGV